jgi:hypothetical protein
MQFAMLLRRLAAANFDLAISADYDPPPDETETLDDCVTIPASEATAIVSANSTWDGFVSVNVRLADLGYSDEQLEAVGRMIGRERTVPLNPIQHHCSHRQAVPNGSQLLRTKVPPKTRISREIEYAA